MIRDPTERFSDRVESYVRARPGYPVSVLEHLEEVTGLLPPRTVSDVGSGTGIFTRLLLERGHTVHAVEPNAAMRRAAEEALSGFPRFRSVEGRAEATSLGDASVDLVTAAQACHWFDPDETRTEWRRILRPPGWAALVWNDRRRRGGAFEEAYETLLRRFGGEDYGRVRASWDVRANLARLFAGGDWTEGSVTNAQSLDREGLERRLLSSSYLPASGRRGHEEMLDAARSLFEAHARSGVVRIEYDTRVYVGRLRPDGGPQA